MQQLLLHGGSAVGAPASPPRSPSSTCCYVSVTTMPTLEAGSNVTFSYEGTFPDNFKLVKTVQVFPLELTAIGSVDPRSGRCGYSLVCRVRALGGAWLCHLSAVVCMCLYVMHIMAHMVRVCVCHKRASLPRTAHTYLLLQNPSSPLLQDVVLRGRLTWNASRSALEYRKALPLPLPFLGGVLRPVLAAEWRVDRHSPLEAWRRPRLQLGLAADAADGDGSRSGAALDDGAALAPDGTLSFRRKAFVTRHWGLEVDGTARCSIAHDLADGASPGAVAGALRLAVSARELNVVCRV